MKKWNPTFGRNEHQPTSSIEICIGVIPLQQARGRICLLGNIAQIVLGKKRVCQEQPILVANTPIPIGTIHRHIHNSILEYIFGIEAIESPHPTSCCKIGIIGLSNHIIRITLLNLQQQQQKIQLSPPR